MNPPKPRGLKPAARNAKTRNALGRRKRSWLVRILPTDLDSPGLAVWTIDGLSGIHGGSERARGRWETAAMDSRTERQPENRRENTCVAGVLIGGRSRRMGRPKALLPHPIGGTLVEHVIHMAHEVADEVFLLGKAESLPPTLASLPLLPDVREELGPPGGLGPLAGLCSLLGVAGDRWALLLPCDMPNIAVSLLTRLLVRASDAVDAVAYSREGRADGYHACCALYHPRLLPAVLDELEGSGRSLQALLGRSRVKAIRPNGEDRLMLANVNTPGDYERIHVTGRST